MSSLLVTEKDRIELDTVRLLAVHSGDSEHIRLRSGIANVNIRGIYKVSELGSIFQQSVAPYFKTAVASSPAPKSKYSFTVSVHIVDNPSLKAFLPSLERFEEFRLTGRFVSDSGWYANADLPALTVGSTHVEDFTLNAGTKKDSLVVKISAGLLKLGGNTIYNMGLEASAANDHLDFATRFKDRAGKEKYSLSGMVVHQQDEYTLSLAENLLLNYQKWSIDKNNSIKIGSKDIAIHNFTLKHSNEQLVLQSMGNTSNSPLKADFSNFTIGTLAAFVMPDSLVINGMVNGSLDLRNMMQKPSFSGDLTINNLSFKKDTAGDLRVTFTSNSSDQVHAEMKLTGRGNTVDISGNYYPAATDGNEIKVDANLSQLNLAAVEGLTMGEVTHASGNITGKITLSGKISAPTINGSLNFKKVAFTLTMLNSQFKVDDKDLVINPEGIKFDNFTVRDSANNSATLNGMVYTTNFTSYKFALTIAANNFRILNTPKNANKLYYGQLYFSSNMKVSGTDLLPVVDGRITILDKTKLTVAIPENAPGIESRKGIVQFVNRKVPENDTLFMSTVINDSINRARVTGLDITANIEIKKDAEFNLIVDEANGDFLRMKGEGLLSSGIDRSGKITLSGSYELTEGTYEMTFNFLKRKFNIQPGSRIVWEGDPLKATLDITAIYTANAAPYDLVKDQLGDATGTVRNTYLQRLPFQVYLKAQGELLHPFISFDIQLPQDKNYGVGQDVVESSNIKLTQLRQDQSELNKQVFALLLLNRFITENPFESSTGGLSAETFARQSASRLLTEQLNQLATDLVKGVDVNFDVSSTQDYSTGSEVDKTELNVSLSKRLLNDQLTVTVGSNFQLEGQNTNQDASNIAGDVAIDYKLSKDGRYMLRAYRKNEYEGIVDGYVVETGVGFIFTLDYNRFRDIFLSEKKKEERRKARKAATNQKGP
jgi:translocation and assembly module TamB